MSDNIHALLNFWFGALGHADLPSRDRTNLWFGESEQLKQEMIKIFDEEYKAAVAGHLNVWSDTPRGRLALIILLDQFSRWAHRNTSSAFAYDQTAQSLCIEGLRNNMDQ